MYYILHISQQGCNTHIAFLRIFSNKKDKLLKLVLVNLNNDKFSSN